METDNQTMNSSQMGRELVLAQISKQINIEYFCFVGIGLTYLCMLS